jgi:hydroxyacyl-ACP dehydratase HTD2-like protein with hotdog domain
MPEARTLVQQEWRPDELELFLFSAALWLPHRIHYDREFAVSDGHRGLVVHGPLQIARLLEAAGAWSREAGGRIASADFRHVSPAVAGDTIRLSLELSDGEAPPDASVLRIAARAGVVCPSGECTETTTGTITIDRER